MKSLDIQLWETQLQNDSLIQDIVDGFKPLVIWDSMVKCFEHFPSNTPRKYLHHEIFAKWAEEEKTATIFIRMYYEEH